MNNLNIPTYRAKMINSDEYVEGYYEYIKGSRGYENYVIKYNKEIKRQFINCNISIDLTTLAINFPSMLDSQGNKIFASLNENGKGGTLTTFDYLDCDLSDKLKEKYLNESCYVIKYNEKRGIHGKGLEEGEVQLFMHQFRFKYTKVIGIQE